MLVKTGHDWGAVSGWMDTDFIYIDEIKQML